jgi:hypothetical protein
MEGELKPTIKHLEVPSIFLRTYSYCMHTLKCQSEDYETPRSASYIEVFLKSQPNDIKALKFIQGLCLFRKKDKYENELESTKINIKDGCTTKNP